MSDFKIYSGEEFFGLEVTKRKFIIDNIIKEKDSFLIVGDEKAGKSLLVFQMICSLTSGHPFLDRFTVNKISKVAYIQIEGEITDSLDRFQRMIKVIDFDKTKFQIHFSAPIDLQQKAVKDNIVNSLRPFAPDIVIIDPIYFALSGSLSDDMAVRAFIGNLRELKNELQCTLGLVHHTHKLKLDVYGKPVSEGDEAIFGSKFFKAWADHTILFAYDKKRGVRMFSCGTQRGGDITSAMELKLVQPDPLYFEETDKPTNRSEQIIELLRNAGTSGLTPDECMKALDMKRNTFYSSIKEPLSLGLIHRVVGRPIRLKLP